MGEASVPGYQQPHIIHRMFSHRVLVAIILAIVVAASVYLWLLFRTETIPADFDFQVSKTDTVQSVANNLMNEGVIKHRLFFFFTYYVFGRHVSIEPGGYKLSNTMRVRDLVYALESKPASRYVTIPANASKEQIGKILADALGWGELDRQFFSHTYAGMQWQHYQEHIEQYFEKQYKWNETKTHTFLTLSALYYDGTYDFLKNMYVPGTYEIPVTDSRAQVAGILIDSFTDKNPDDAAALAKYVDKASTQNIVKLIDDEMVLMPDIVAIPPQDLTLKKENGHTYLLFTTSYWNKGRGPLELVADPNTKGIKADIERNIYQRIYHLDGDYTERLAGKFLWHQPHLHYHFQDFAVYTLESGGPSNGTIRPIQSQKSTFCIRDSEPIDLSHPGASKSPSYTICGKERQGISPGWADSYYYTYVDQRFDVTTLAPGKYILKIIINPLDRFDEITKDNNVGEAIFDLDVAHNSVKVISEKNYGI